jgi:phage gpG-like protein
MTFEEFSIHIKNLQQKLGQFINDDAPEYTANIAVEKFKENFDKEGFFGAQWQEVQRRKPETKAYKAVAKKHPADTQRKILTGRTGNLRNSINYRTEPGVAIIYSDTPYGAYHNDGTGKLPKRQFIGDHPQLDKDIMDKLKTELDKIIK